jgi:hypothetical protein
MQTLSLQSRAEAFNIAYAHLPHQHLVVAHDTKRNPFLHGFWFCSGGNISDFYGSYQVEYLNRIDSMFNDCRGKTEFVHLFAGSIPVSPHYTVVGLPDGGYNPEFKCDAQELSSYLPFKPALILADPPYEEAAAGKYAICNINRSRVVDECARVLRPGGFLVWMDQGLPTFSNDVIRLVGGITYIRSTGNRFRVVSIFQKPLRK